MMKRIIYGLFAIVLIGSLVALSLPRGGSSVQEEFPATEGGTINLYGIDPLTLDPAVSGDATSHEYVVQLFSGLVRLGDDMEPVPDIAERWEISEDGRTYTFYLRQGVRFHDGREVKADDFKYSWERACSPATMSQTAAVYLGDIVGVGEVLAGVSDEISGVRVVDDYTLEVTIDAPRSYFLAKLTYPTSFVVDRDNVEAGGEWWRQPIGTGPFKLKQWTENSLFVLERDELYYGELAKVDYVVWYMWSGVSMNMYEMGEIDVTGVSIDYIDKVIDETGLFYEDLVMIPEMSFFYIGFDCSKPPFDDVNVRRAFSQAVDKDKLVSLVFRNMVQRADGILPPGMPGFNEELGGLDYDVAEAIRLIRESEYGDVSNLPSITITTAGWGGTISQSLEAIVQEWRDNLGVEVEVRQIEPERFLYHLDEEKDEMFFTGWIADYPHPQDFLEVLFYTGANNNAGGYSNFNVDFLLDMAGAEPASEDLGLQLYQQAEQELVDDAACIPLWFGQNNVLVKPYITGYNLTPMGFAMLNEVSVEPH
jgi:oligopeptide transport system substrate-binding protein